MKMYFYFVAFLFCSIPLWSQPEWPHFDYNAGVSIDKYIPQYVNARYKEHIPDGKGGLWVFFTFISVNNVDTVYFQHVDRNGALSFPDGKAKKMAFDDFNYCSDELGGIIVSVREFNPASQKFVLKCFRFTTAGSPVWGADGLVVDNVNNISRNFSVTASYGAYYAAVQGVNGMTYVHKISEQGNLLWQSGGVVASQTYGVGFQAFDVKSTAGTYKQGVDVLWQKEDTLFVQRYASNGVVYSSQAQPISFFKSEGRRLTKIVRMKNAEAWYLAWSDSRYGTNSGSDIYLLRYGAMIDGIGDTGKVVCRTIGEQTDPILTGDGQDGVIITWQDRRNSGQTSYPQFFAQRFLSNGTMQWTQNGVQISSNTSTVNYIQVLPPVVRNTEFIYIFAEENSGIYAQKLNLAGQTQWYGSFGRIHSWKFAFLYDRLEQPNGDIICLFSSSVGIQPEAKLLDRQGYLGDNAPRLADVKDIINDQGGRITAAFNASWQELNPLPNQFSNNYFYRLYRGISAQNVPEGVSIVSASDGADHRTAKGRLLDLSTTTALGERIYWEQVAEMAPLGVNGYSKVIATTSDSGRQGIPWNYVMASYGNFSNYPQVVWYSNIDSGYSVDNLPPFPPQAATGSMVSGAVQLQWKKNFEADFAEYEIYRSTAAGFIPNEQNLLATTVDTLYRDVTAPSNTAQYYIIKAVDVNGNRSDNSAQISLNVLEVINANIPLPTEYALDQNYPNPFNPSTTIVFTLPAGNHTTVRIFDALGRSVETLVNGYRATGRYTVEFRAAHHASGMYFCEVRSGEFVKRIKMNLVK